MKTFRYFGTDGIRGTVGKPPITPDFTLKLGWTIGQIMSDSSKKSQVIIGKDTRISGYMFESALQAGLVASGNDILLCGPISTPAVSYLTRTFNACAGIVISASHNDYADNGIKIFNPDGTKISEDIQHKIESMIDMSMHTVPSKNLGRASRINDAGGRYIEFCKSSIHKNMSLRGLRIVVDCANGATYNTAPSVFKELGADVITIGDDPDGFNINKGCGSTSPELAAESVVKYRADFGVVLDGDGDRIIMIDEKGQIASGDDLLFILASHWHNNGTLRGGVVGTDMTNMGLENYFKKQSIGFVRVAVGDRNIIAKLSEKQWLLGGETSGHILCPHISIAGDGIIVALQIIAALIEQKQTLSQVKKGYQPYCQHLTNLVCSYKNPVGEQNIVDIIKKHEKTLQSSGRIFVRKSGTEAKLRILVEAKDPELAETTSKAITEEIDVALQRR